jgi:two-component system CheB/CheR fusion protein
VFANLLNNSAKYSEPASRFRSPSDWKGRCGRCGARRGIGIHRHAAARLRDVSATGSLGSRARGGLGIGLSLSSGSSSLHGGTVTAHERGTGHGSEFVVRIPAMAARMPRERGAQHVHDTVVTPPDPGRRRQTRMRPNPWRRCLSINGHERAWRTTAAMRSSRPALQYRCRVPDIGMPTLDGHATAKLIREQPWGTGTWCWCADRMGASEDRRRSKDAGFNPSPGEAGRSAVVQKQLCASLF